MVSILGANSVSGGYEVSNSLRFNDDDSAYLTRTPSSAGNRKTWTWSAWIKRGNISTTQKLFMAYGGNNEGGYTSIDLDSNDTFRVTGYAAAIETTTALLRDVSAWYHLMVVFDTTQATEANRVKMYINGEQAATSQGGSHPDQNFEPAINNNVIHTIGARYLTSATGEFLDGYMTEVNFIDGTAKSPTDFGEFDDNNVWIPKEYTGSYGTNGFFLQFKQTGTSQNASGIGADTSGNDNHFAVTNLAATDVMLDSPTNNWATFNPLFKYDNEVLYEGNLKADTGSLGGTIGTFGLTSGKWYWEIRPSSVNAVYTPRHAGITEIQNAQTSLYTKSVYYESNGKKNINNTSSSYGATFTGGDILGVALDIDNQTVTYYKNNSSQGSIDISSVYSIGDTITFSHAQSAGVNQTAIGNFGQDSSFAGNETRQNNSDGNGFGDFYYAPPSGFLALCTQNLATELSPTIDDGSQYFNTVLWTGNGGTNAITGVGFKPDLVWGKDRTGTDNHHLFDTTRGTNQRLISNSSAAENTESNCLDSFDSDGFTLGSNTGLNNNGDAHVAWNWKANGGTTSSNTSGSITSTVQADTTAGFSIVLYTGNATNGATVGHGLGKVPSMVITKARDDSPSHWRTYHSALTDHTYAVTLNDTHAQTTGYGLNASPTSSVFELTNSSQRNQNTINYVAYCFAEIKGYSKFGSYTGNNNADGVFVYTGFKPAFIITKKIDGAYNWGMLDATRSSFNVADDWLGANLNNAESEESTRGADLLSNGFKPRGNNGDINHNSPYLYMAFAEHPFVSSEGVPVTAR
jgi:hypothetical protein